MIKQLSIFTTFITLSIAILDYLELLTPHTLFTWMCLIFFVVTTLLVFGLASLSTSMKNTQNGSFVILGAMGVKFFLSITFIIAFYMLTQPALTFIIPFFVLYVLFSIIETYFLLVLSKNTPSDTQK